MHRRTFLDRLAAAAAAYVVRPSLAAAAQPTAWHERLPKVELHLHLEGAIPKTTVWELAADFQRDPGWRDAAASPRAPEVTCW
jgi:hypothetical protein